MVELKCDPEGSCKMGDACTNSRVYVSNLPRGCTAEDIADSFGGLGVIARERPSGRGVFPDMMPHRIKFYGNDDCLIQYEDSHAAHAAPSFFDGTEMKGSKLRASAPRGIIGGRGRGGAAGASWIVRRRGSGRPPLVETLVAATPRAGRSGDWLARAAPPRAGRSGDRLARAAPPAPARAIPGAP